MLAFSRDGHLLASASHKGTVIRVHLVPQAIKLYTLRRGTYPAAVHSLAFSPPPLHPLHARHSNLLACTSDTGSVHIFRLPTGGRGSATPGLLASLLPGMADLVDSNRCFCIVRNASPSGVRR